MNVGYSVGPAGLGGTAQVHSRRWLEASVCAAVEVNVGLLSDHCSVTHDAGLELDNGGMARVARGKFLDVVHDHLHRTAGAVGQVIGQGDVHGRAFSTKIATDTDGIDPDACLRKAPSRGQLLFYRVGNFAGRPHLHSARLVDPN